VGYKKATYTNFKAQISETLYSKTFARSRV